MCIIQRTNTRIMEWMCQFKIQYSVPRCDLNAKQVELSSSEFQQGLKKENLIQNPSEGNGYLISQHFKTIHIC